MNTLAAAIQPRIQFPFSLFIFIFLVLFNGGGAYMLLIIAVSSLWLKLLVWICFMAIWFFVCLSFSTDPNECRGTFHCTVCCSTHGINIYWRWLAEDEKRTRNGFSVFLLLLHRPLFPIFVRGSTWQQFRWQFIFGFFFGSLSLSYYCLHIYFVRIVVCFLVRLDLIVRANSSQYTRRCTFELFQIDFFFLLSEIFAENERAHADFICGWPKICMRSHWAQKKW